jgi:hypothetical protein
VQGPIPRHGQLASQLYEGHDFDYTRMCHGVQLMVWGLFKKLVIGERIAIPVNALFDGYASYSGPILFLAAAMYGLQVYADFSGGMDVARGVAQILGIELELNFRQPYFSSSVEEFWRRWHMTMGNWMRDYVFYPLSMSKAFTAFGQKSRKVLGQYVGKRLPPFCAMFIVYILVGLWHGAAWNYVVFGLWNGVFIMLGILMDGLHDKARQLLRIQEETVTWRAFRIIRTFVVISFGRYFSRGNSLRDALDMIGRSLKNWRDITFLTNGTLLKLGLDTANWVVLGIFLLVLFHVDLAHEKGVALRESIDKQSEQIMQTREAFGMLDNDIKDTAGQIDDITKATANLEEMKNKIVDSVCSLSAICQENSASTQETTASMQELDAVISQATDGSKEVKERAKALMDDVSVFKV